jgi:hypothetical protein
MAVIELSSVSMAHRFFLEEVEAFHRTAAQIDTVEALKPVAHAVLWAWTLDDVLTRESRDQLPSSPKGHTPYEVAREATEDGRCMRGVRYLRNRLAHQFVDVLDTRGGAALPMRLPAPLHEFIWLPVTELPPADVYRGQSDLRDVYAAELASQPVRFTFDRLTSFFSWAVNQPPIGS